MVIQGQNISQQQSRKGVEPGIYIVFFYSLKGRHLFPIRKWQEYGVMASSLKGISNPSLYLTAYLGDRKVTEAIQAGTFRDRRLTETKDKRQAVVKGGRLKLHPVGFNLYRCSRGIKRPEIWQTTEEQVQEEIIGKVLAYEKTVSITDESGTQRNIINYHTCCNLPSEETETFTTEDREIFDAGSG